MQSETPKEELPFCFWARPSSPACVYLLADHLDAVLAAAEDMTSITITWNSASSTEEENGGIRDLNALHASVEDLRSLELALVARILKSRERAEELIRADPRLKLMAKLFLSGTAAILDSLQELTDDVGSDFNAGDATLAYLRARELLAADVAAPADGADLCVTEAFPVGRCLRLATLMDLVAQFLDTIELYHDIYTGPLTPAEVAGMADNSQQTAKDMDMAKVSTTEASKERRTGATPPRKGYRSLAAALAELEERDEAPGEAPTTQKKSKAS